MRIHFRASTPPHLLHHASRTLTHPSVAQRIGYTVFGLYIAQVVLGTFIHYVRIPFPFLGHRPPQNYIHALLGLAILSLADYQVRPCRRYFHQRGFFSFELGKQVHHGIYVEWPVMTTNVHPVKQSAKHAWLALVIVSRTTQTAFPSQVNSFV